MRPTRMLATTGVVAILVAAGLGTFAGRADAHSQLVRMEPADGAIVATAPTRVRLLFNEAVQSRYAIVAVTAPGGRAGRAGQARGGRCHCHRGPPVAAQRRPLHGGLPPDLGGWASRVTPPRLRLPAARRRTGPGGRHREGADRGSAGVGQRGWAPGSHLGVGDRHRRFAGGHCGGAASSQDQPVTTVGTVLSEVTARRRSWLRWLLLMTAAAGVLVTALLFGGGRPQPSAPGLPDAGGLTGWGLPLIRLGADVAGVAAVGYLLTAALLLPAPRGEFSRSALRCLRAALVASCAWSVLASAEIVFTFSDFLARPLQSLAPHQLGAFVASIPQAQGLLVQAVLALLLAVVIPYLGSPRSAAAALLLALVALVPPALTGHSAATGDHMLAISSLTVHVAAAAMWIGGSSRYRKPLHAGLVGDSDGWSAGTVVTPPTQPSQRTQQKRSP